MSVKPEDAFAIIVSSVAAQTKKHFGPDGQEESYGFFVSIMRVTKKCLMPKYHKVFHKAVDRAFEEVHERVVGEEKKIHIDLSDIPQEGEDVKH